MIDWAQRARAALDGFPGHLLGPSRGLEGLEVFPARAYDRVMSGRGVFGYDNDDVAIQAGEQVAWGLPRVRSFTGPVEDALRRLEILMGKLEQVRDEGWPAIRDRDGRIVGFGHLLHGYRLTHSSSPVRRIDENLVAALGAEPQARIELRIASVTGAHGPRSHIIGYMYDTPIVHDGSSELRALVERLDRESRAEVWAEICWPYNAELSAHGVGTGDHQLCKAVGWRYRRLLDLNA